MVRLHAAYNGVTCSRGRDLSTSLKILLVLAAIVFLGTALAHLSCILFGPTCYKIQMAPELAVELAESNWLLASILNVLVSTLFVVAGLYLLSSAKLLPQPPLFISALLIISAVCSLRGIATVPLYYAWSSAEPVKALVVGLVWFAVGCITYVGYLNARKTCNKQRQ